MLSRNPRGPYLDGVSYYSCDISDLTSLRALLLKLQPQVVINTASPICYDDVVDKSLLDKVNVVGTRNLLEISRETKSTQAFVHTSSASVHVWSTARFRKEDAPLVDRSTTRDEYAITKAIADRMVLKADCPDLRTLCLRSPGIYGERDTQFIPGSLAVLRDKKTHIQLGDNKNLFDAIYVGNAATAHVLAAKALLADGASTKVAGEAFFITDDAAMPFWDFQRKIWAEAGDKTPLSAVRILPAWIGMAMATLVEYLFWFFTFAQKLPPKSLRRDTLRYAITERTFCTNKAREQLGYRPLVSTDEGIRRGVEWALQHHTKGEAGK